MSNIYYVKKTGANQNEGSKANPFLTISKAAQVAMTGDTVIVCEGEYRERVAPKNSGVTYMVQKGDKVVIKGSEQIEKWEQVEAHIWKTEVDNQLFGDFNPYEEIVWGDWLIHPEDRLVHLGDVYLNGKSLYEAYSMEDLKQNEMRLKGFTPSIVGQEEDLKDPEGSLYKWIAQVGETHTTIYANFQNANPNEELVEINVRKYCFFPETTGVNYITVSGFEMCHAATGWAPPTADQPGLIGPNWSKGWIIEHNIFHDAKCSAVSLGKEKSTGHNDSTLTFRKPGYQYQLEDVFLGLEKGWSKENIGSHIVRNNTIYDCGQNAIVGHMGSAFCQIHENHIYNIGVKYEYYGFEIAGIKLHAAIDTYIHNNRIHDCSLGTWLDWQAQGTRVSKNLYYNNERDIFIEVTHGPCVVDNNIFASKFSIDNIAQGTALIHNLFCGGIYKAKVLNRATQYHFAHTTRVKGFTFVYSGDDRIYNNIFAGGDTVSEKLNSGTSNYDMHPSSYEEYIDRIKAQSIRNDHMRFFEVEQAVYMGHNAYFNHSSIFSGETEYYQSESPVKYHIFEEEGQVYLEVEVEETFANYAAEMIDTEKLGTTRVSECAYDDFEGNDIIFNTDIVNEKRSSNSIAGPIAKLETGKNRIKIWG